MTSSTSRFANIERVTIRRYDKSPQPTEDFEVPPELLYRFRVVASFDAEMQFLCKTAVLLLLTAVIVAPLKALENYPSVGGREALAGCHEDSGNVPTHRPVSHSCCQGGHHTAIVQQGTTSRSPLRGSAWLALMPDSVPHGMLASSPNLMIVCSDPPIISPLRV